MSDETFKDLTEIVRHSKYLRHLDLSWCERNYEDFLPFYEMLALNRRLRSINLSWNSLFDHKRGEEEDVLSADDELGVSCFERFMKNNINLIHINLGYSQISDRVSKRLVAALTRSPSVRALHLDGNPCITEDFIRFVEDRIKAPDSQQPVHRIKHPPNIRPVGLKMTADEMQETIRLKAIMKTLRDNEQKLDIPTIEKTKLILTRNIGLKGFGMGLGQWRVNTLDHQDCYVCRLHMPCFIFWSSSTAPLMQNNVTGELRDFYVKRSQKLFDDANLDESKAYI